MYIRPAQPQDSLAVAKVHVRSWQVGYQYLLPQDYLDSLNPEDRASRYDFANTDPARPKTFVAVEGEVISGFVTISTAIDVDTSGCGQLSALYVDPDRWRRSVGSRLLVHAHAQLSAAGCRQAVLWVLAGNDRAERFYQHHGWVADGNRRRDLVWNIAIDELRFRTRLKHTTHE